LAFYPPLWRKLLDLAKAQMRLHIAVKNVFPWLEQAVNGIYREVLIEVIAHFEDKGWEVEAGYYPAHRSSMCRLLFNDTQTFRSDIKKAIMKTLPFDYGLYPPPDVGNEGVRIKFVKDRADELLKTSAYLCGEPDALGKASNFAHPTINNACLSLYYSNTSSKSLRQFVEFQTYILYKALILVAAVIHTVLSTLRKHGSEVTGHLVAEDIKCAYNGLEGQVNCILGDPYHGPKLNTLLE
ncbi:hypothetical protein SCLCIDRAFT_44221, partial [Scleroderma citrinum Foug A]